MKYRYEINGDWISYGFVGTGFWQTWRIALLFIATGVKLGLTGRTTVVLPLEKEA